MTLETLDMICDLSKAFIYLTFYHMGVPRAQKLKMKGQKILYFRHYEKLLDNMNNYLMDTKNAVNTIFKNVYFNL